MLPQSAREMLADQSLPGSVRGANPESYSLLYSQVWWMSLTQGEAGAFRQAVHEEFQKEDSYLKRSLRRADEARLLPLLLEPWAADAPDAAAKRSENMTQWIMLGEALPGQGNDGHTWLKRMTKAGWLRPEDMLAKAVEFIQKNPLSGEVLPDLVSLALEAKDDAALSAIISTAKETLSYELHKKGFQSVVDRLRMAERFKDGLALLEYYQEQERKGGKPPEESGYTVRKLDLAFQEAGVSGGRDAVLRLAALHFTKDPADKATWTALPWACMHLAARAEKAGRKEEALEFLKWSAITSRATTRHQLEYPGVGLPWLNDQVKALIKSLGEEEKAFTAATSPDSTGPADIIKSAGPTGEALPEAVRQKLTTRPE